ncbi:postacrosomal sheath WW domain-binding protein [Meriones unguiculatus]|uniref:postacrosomal sheath WW domain-binding protein n=1 Tax=Meriones unguiculatus TaxID=10047 RepID=UPI00293EE3AC|nr:postacrosomal sheath WW domain-binding protein [Meriones unguiculatus]
MAVNQNHTVDPRWAAIPPGESLLMKSLDVDLSFPQSPPGSNLFSGTRRGTLFLTSYRVIFVTSRPNNDPMLSFTMPFHLMSNCSVEQPVFSANYIKGTIQAAPDGGWEGSATFKMVFRKGGAIDFAQLMAKAASAAAQGFPLRVASFWMGPPGIYLVPGERHMYAPQASQAAYGVPPAGYGAPPPRYDVLPPGYGAERFRSPPPLYVATPAGYGVPPPGYGAPPPGYGAPPPGYGAPPPGYGAPPPGYEDPAVEYGVPPPRYETTSVQSGSPPPRYEAPPVEYGAPPSGSGSVPSGSRAPRGARETPPAGSAAAHTHGFQASFPSTSSSRARSPPSKK